MVRTSQQRTNSEIGLAASDVLLFSIFLHRPVHVSLRTAAEELKTGKRNAGC